MAGENENGGAAAAAAADSEKTPEQIWAEMDAADGAAAKAAEAAPAADTGADPEFDAANAAADADTAKAAEEAAGKKTDAAPAGTDTKPKEAAPDPWASAPPELKAAYEAEKTKAAQLEQRIKSDEGRVSSFQRQAQETAAENARLLAEKEAAAPAAAATPRKKPAELLEKLKEDYAEIAEPLTEAFGAVTAQLDQLHAVEQSRINAATRDQEARAAAEKTEFLKDFPDYADTVAKNAPEFRKWVLDQDLATRQAYEVNRVSIVNAAAGKLLMGKFTEHLQKIGAMAAPAAEVAKPAADPATTQQATLDQRRQRQLEASAAPGKTPAVRIPALSEIPADGDPELIWAAMEAEEAKRAEAIRRGTVRAR